MHLCKFICYKLKVFKIIYNILPFICVEAPLKYALDCILSIKRPKTGMFSKHITHISKDHDNQKQQHISLGW